MEKKLNILIVDDEEESRDLLGFMLAEYPGVKVCGKAADVNQALKMVDETRPDLVLLDIHMPEKDGFQLITELHDREIFPGIIFVTAFENYALKAIRSSAFDYILKPVGSTELFNAIERFRNDRNRQKANSLAELIDVLQQSKPGKIRLNTRTGYFLIDPEDLVYCMADGNYCHLYLTNGKTEITTQNLGSIEKMLERHNFLRISRSYLLNMNYLSKVDRKANTCELEYDDKIFRIKIPPQKIRLLEEFF
ncbi:MAG: LytR/AlgR family response regulator transcription factor [Bacteroidota bacterium]